MKHHIFLTLTLLFVLVTSATFAQQVPNIDTLNSKVQQMEKVYNALSKIKFSGYIQAQFQVADSTGISSFEGGSFAPQMDKRLMVRRGRLKVQHTGNISLMVLQIDMTEKGVGVKDVYLTITEPWTKTLSLTAGVFNRPFGFELPYSSSQRESPERGRMSQIIFPGERDMGAMLAFQPVESSALKFLRLEAGIFNGNGINTDFDKQKDFIGRLRLNEVVNSSAVKFSAGASYYNGGWLQSSSTVYEIGTLGTGANGFVAFTDTAFYGKTTEREYIGADAQLAIKWVAGTTTLRGEYITGQQPGLANSTGSPGSGSAPSGAVYNRNFDGAYFYFIHDILKTGHQLVVKYDWYDPNTDVEPAEIGLLTSNLGAAEIRYESLGFGYNYQFNPNLKLMAFYQMVTNESTNLSGYTQDLSDNVFTLRLQHKF